VNKARIFSDLGSFLFLVIVVLLARWSEYGRALSPCCYGVLMKRMNDERIGREWSDRQRGLHHANNERCIFHHGYLATGARTF
jgi:hypothetical protein